MGFQLTCNYLPGVSSLPHPPRSTVSGFHSFLLRLGLQHDRLERLNNNDQLTGLHHKNILNNDNTQKRKERKNMHSLISAVSASQCMKHLFCLVSHADKIPLKRQNGIKFEMLLEEEQQHQRLQQPHLSSGQTDSHVEPSFRFGSTWKSIWPPAWLDLG